jgi:hypothetical protein
MSILDITPSCLRINLDLIGFDFDPGRVILTEALLPDDYLSNEVLVSFLADFYFPSAQVSSVHLDFYKA